MSWETELKNAIERKDFRRALEIIDAAIEITMANEKYKTLADLLDAKRKLLILRDTGRL